MDNCRMYVTPGQLKVLQNGPFGAAVYGGGGTCMAINDPDLRPNGGGQIQYRKAASHSLFFSMN